MSLKGGEVVFNFKGEDKELKNSINDIGSSIKKMVTALGLDRLISKTMSALNNSLDGAIKRVDTMNNFPRVMNNLGIATEDATEAVNELSDGLTGLPTTLNDGVSAVQRFTSQNNDVKKSTKIFLALNNAILAGGASTEVQASAIEQLSQAYAKGKPDAMEWRSMLTAMPAQLKQVAKAMGYTSTAVGGDLYTAIQKGKVSMDDFMDTIIKLNDEGIDSFASFSEQAKSSTGGIATSITNVKTAITRGLANSIEALNKSLKSANLPTVNEMIQKVGTTISKAFNKVNEAIKKINWTKLIPVIKDVTRYIGNLKDTVLGLFKNILKSIDWNMVLQIAPTILKIVATFQILNPLIKTTSSIIGGLGSVFTALRNPTMLLITALSALATAFVVLSASKSEEEQRMIDLSNSIQDANRDMKDYNKTVDANMKKSVAQIDHTKKLSDELKTLVDENGKVKEGYKDRVKFILNQLNEALGTEYKLNGDVVESYKEIQNQIDKTLEKKRAETILNAEEEKYKKAIEARTQAYEQLQQIYRETGLTYEEVMKKIQEYEADPKNLENMMWMNEYGDDFKALQETIKTSTDNMKQYENDYALFTEGKFNEIGQNIKTSTQDWTDKTDEIIKENFATQEEDLKALLNTYKTTGDEQHRNQIDEKLRDLALKRSEMQERKGIVTRMTSEEVEAYIRLAQRDRNAYNDIMNKTSGDTRLQMQTIGRIIDQNGYIPENSMRQVANTTSYAFKNLKSSQWGGDLIRGIANGMNNNNSFLSRAVNFAVSTISSRLHFSRPDKGPLRDYEKWMPDFVQGLTKTLNNSTPNLYNSINKMAGKMKDELNLGFGMSPTLNNVSSYNPSVSVTIHNNMETDFMGNLVSNIKTFSNGSKNDYNYGMS
jgi:tape measure domain-containing protein